MQDAIINIHGKQILTALLRLFLLDFSIDRINQERWYKKKTL